MSRRRLALTMLAVGAAACGPPPVARMYGGRVRAERFIDEEAYAAFLQAAEREARGDAQGALSTYRGVVARDERSVEAWTRIGALECARSGDWTAAFERAERLDPGYAGLWRARAECARLRGATDAVATERAFRLDPDDEAAGLDEARSLSERGLRGDAQKLLQNLAIRFPDSLDVWRAVRSEARASGDAAWEREADHRIARVESVRRIPSSSGTAAVEAALADGDLARARAAADAARLGEPERVALAVVAGRPDMAVQLAESGIDADPKVVELRLVGALAADLVGDPARRDRWLTGLVPSAVQPLGPIGEVALADLLRRHARVDALVNRVSSGPTPDSVTAAIAERLRHRGGATDAVPR